jgi:hypothetical protein
MTYRYIISVDRKYKKLFEVNQLSLYKIILMSVEDVGFKL